MKEYIHNVDTHPDNNISNLPADSPPDGTVYMAGNDSKTILQTPVEDLVPKGPGYELPTRNSTPSNTVPSVVKVPKK